MRIPKYQIPKSQKLVIFSDVHDGAEHHDTEAWKEALRWCKDSDAAIFLNGDLMNNASTNGKNAGEKLLEQISHPHQQVKSLVSALKPFAKRGRIVGITRGNHEAWSRRESMIDLCEIIAEMLEVPYLRLGGYIQFQSGPHLYTGGIQHGRSSSKNIWGELDRLMKDVYTEADFVAAGHNHALDARMISRLSIKDGFEGVEPRWQIRTGTYLGYADYARELALAPSALGSPVITFSSGKQRSMDVCVKTLRWLR